MSTSVQRNALKSFLRARRAALTPEMVGLPVGQRRRTPGLRREELASIAGISVSWYTWLEQGRPIRTSADLLRRLSRALRLSPSDAEYLYRLAGETRTATPSANAVPEPWVQDLLDGFRWPAILMNARFDVVARNEIANRVFAFDAMQGPFAVNHIWRSFCDTERRGLYVNWREVVSWGVGALRAQYGAHIGDPAFESLIEELREHSREFSEMWEAHHVLPLASIPLVLRLPQVGPVGFVSSRLTLPALPEHFIFALTPDEKSAGAVAKLRAGASRGNRLQARARRQR
jgi:transcriptional regulator with XRE-family HTH domain